MSTTQTRIILEKLADIRLARIILNRPDKRNALDGQLLPEAIKMDQLVGAWQQLMIDPLAHVEEYLASQSGGTKSGYRRPDV